ncbi:MAG TPA: hypothetical protein VGD67_07395 [Pseudonocardiaceae bacterium]
MSDPRNGAWKSREVRAAEAALAAAVERGREAVVKAQQVSARVPNTRLSDRDIEEIDRAARGKDAPPELRALAQRVERGDLTWRQIVDGQAMHDPGVQAAMKVNLARLGGVYRKFEEGFGLDEVLEAETGRTARRAARADAGRDGEDDDDQGSVLKHSSW